MYQEQIMKIAEQMARFSLAEADLLRRAISKKTLDKWKKRNNVLLKGACKWVRCPYGKRIV